MSDEKRQRWRMPLEELCHRLRVRPADLERWASLGALGPAWRESTEGKWRHITRAAARRATAMRALVDAGLTEEAAAPIADSIADGLGRGQAQSVDTGSGRIEVDPSLLDMP